MQGALGLLVLGWLVVVALYVAWGPGDHPSRDLWLYVGLMVGSAGVTLARGVLVARDRAVWLALGVGLLMSSAGDLVYTLTVAGLDPEPFPSVADPLYLAYYPLCATGIVFYVRSRAREAPLDFWRDGVMIALALGGLVGAVFLAPLSDSLKGGAWAVAIGAAYPLADTAILLLGAVGVILVGLRRAHGLLWIGASMAVSAFADLGYWNLLASGGYVEGTLLDAAWPLSSILVAFGAWLPDIERSERTTTSRGLMIIPGAALVTATATLAYGTVHPVPLPTVAMAVLALLGVLDRLNGTVRSTLAMMAARREATTDDLTGLPNRRGFTTTAEALLLEAGHAPGSVLLLADLDGFKEVNDSLGHHAGDEVLRAVTARLLAEAEAPGTLIGRLGGDEFALLLTETEIETGTALAARLCDAIAMPFQVEGTRVTLTASIGLSAGPRDGRDLSDLLRRADIAMYRAKTGDLGLAVFDPQIDLAGEDRLQRIAELRQAIDRGELLLHYQPKIALDDGSVVGVEALVRWDRPGHGLVYPDAFLPLAGRAGLMRAVTKAVLEQATAQAARWRAAGISLPIAVNLPPAVLIDETLPEHVADLLREHGLPGSCLQVEITEEALLRDRARAQAVLASLRDLGVQASIDDYGTGYSSLVYLRELVVDEVKIDRSFVVPMLLDDRSSSIVRSTIELAHALGMRVVAEGIEEADVAEQLARFGCDFAQGYHWSRPLPAAELDRWLRAYASGPRSTPADLSLDLRAVLAVE